MNELELYGFGLPIKEKRMAEKRYNLEYYHDEVSLGWLAERADHSFYTTAWNCPVKDTFLSLHDYEFKLKEWGTPIKTIHTQDWAYLILGLDFMVKALPTANRVEFTCLKPQGLPKLKKVRQIFPEIQKGEYVKWFHDNGMTSMKLKGPNPQADFYPWIENLETLYLGFKNSTANVLLLIGPPGTGKTTFIRGFLRVAGMEAWVTYEPKVQANERFYTEFASLDKNIMRTSEDDPDDTDDTEDTQGRVLVLEDSDAMLESRKDGNALMNRILNISDGLIQLPKRKLIFSTNLPSLNSVDQALLRPGRCYGVIKFRELTRDQAYQARRAANLPHKELATGSYTLGAVLCGDNFGTEQAVKQIGF